MLTTMSWAVTAWPPVGGLGGLRANSFTICTVKTFTSSRHGHTHTDRDSYALMEMRTDLTAVPHAGLGYHFLRVQVDQTNSIDDHATG